MAATREAMTESFPYVPGQAPERRAGNGAWPERSAGEPDRSAARAIDARRLNRALGWVSIGLGVAEVLAPRQVARLVGAGNHATVVRLCGLRELASGVGLLSGRAPAAAAASRLAGDVIDIALLGAALASRDAKPARLALAATAVLGVSAVDAYATKQHARTALAQARQGVPVSASIAIDSTPQKLYALWRDFTNLPRFMSHLESVTRTGERTSHWVAKAPGGGSVQWDSELVEERENERIAWRTLPGSQVHHHGNVSFEPADNGRGVIVHVEMVYAAPGGTLASGVAKLFGEEPGLQIRRDLRALKQLLETGEVATTRGQPAGRRSVLGRVFARKEQP